MLPLIVGEAEIPDFIEDKLYIDLRTDFFSGITKLVGMIRELDKFRVSEALAKRKPQSVSAVWDLLQSIGFDPYVVLGKRDFNEMLKNGGWLLSKDYAQFSPGVLLRSPGVTDHVKALVKELG